MDCIYLTDILGHTLSLIIIKNLPFELIIHYISILSIPPRCVIALCCSLLFILRCAVRRKSSESQPLKLKAQSLQLQALTPPPSIP
jgi:hypothetical protein